jgi:glycosyltransferase involved in cell wall biosynthesis
MNNDSAGPLNQVTVLLPVFFRETSSQGILMLRRALESVRDQRFPSDYEIVIVDDGSPTPVVSHTDALGIAAKGVRWLRSFRNTGLVHALNTGLAAARFPLIARIDADDRWCAGKIEKQLRLFSEDPDLTITATGMTRVTPEEDEIDQHVRPGDWGGILRFFVDVGCPFPHGSVIARTDTFRLLGGYPHDPAFSHCEDYALWGTWLRFFKPAMIEEALYNYTVSPGSLSGIHDVQQRKASGVVNAVFRDLDLADTLPAAMTELADKLRVSLIDAGKLCFFLWRFRIPVRLPAEALAPLQAVLPDRLVAAAIGQERVLTISRVLEGRGGRHRPQATEIAVIADL